MSETVSTFGGLSAPGLDVLYDMEESGGTAQDLTSAQIFTLRNFFEQEDGLGLYCFTYFICGARDMYFPLHYGMCKVLSKWGYLQMADGSWHKRPAKEGDDIKDSWRRLMLCVPRDHFKTTVGTRSTGLWVITKDPEATVGIWNENGDKSKSWVGATKKVIEESKLYHMLWPEVLPKGIHFMDKEKGIATKRNHKWGDTGLLFRRDSHMVAELSMEPFGIGGASAGKHFTHVIKDDIIGDKASESDPVMNDAIEWVNTARALERPAEGGCELWNYTRWGYYDVYKHALTKWKGQYKVYLRHMLEDEDGKPDVVNGKVIFPTRFTTPQAKEMYEQDPFTFMSQYMVIPMSGRTTSFQPNWIRYGDIQHTTNSDGTSESWFVIDNEDYDSRIMHPDLVDIEESAPRQIPLYMMNKAILLDPAPTKSTEVRQSPRSRNGISVVGKDPWNRRYLLESLPLREDPVSTMHKIVELMLKWNTLRVGIEEVVFSGIYIPTWTALMCHEYPEVFPEFFPMYPKGRDKNSRIFSGLAPAMKTGFWYYNRNETGYGVQELLEFPNGETKDLIDAQSYTDEHVGRDLTPEEERVGEISIYEQNQGRSSITGY